MEEKEKAGTLRIAREADGRKERKRLRSQVEGRRKKSLRKQIANGASFEPVSVKDERREEEGREEAETHAVAASKNEKSEEGT